MSRSRSSSPSSGRQADRDRLVRHRSRGRPARAGGRGAHPGHPGRLRCHGPAGPGRPVRLFAGVRSDPFFADATAPSTASMDRAGRLRRQEHTSIALEVPSDMLGAGPEIGVWATIGRAPRRHPGSRWTAAGTRRSTRSSTPTGRRTCTTPGSPPTTWPITWSRGPRPSWKTRLPARGGRGGRPAGAARHPRYDRTKPATYPNGRTLPTTSTAARFAWLTNGRVAPDGLKPHDDLLSEFPYLGPPSLYPVG